MAGMIVAIVIAVPIILFPVALIWYINAGGMFVAVKENREKKLTTVKPTR
jgi:hypothetical protein